MDERADGAARDRDPQGRARSARPRDGLGRPLPYGQEGVERQPEGVVRSADRTLADAQQLLDEGKPFHAHEVFEDAWKSGPAREAELWRSLAQLAVGLTHGARGNTTGGARLLRRGADGLEHWAREQAVASPHGIRLGELTTWARELAARLERDEAAVDPVSESPALR